MSDRATGARMVVVYKTPADRAAFASEIGQRCAADRKLLAPDADVQMFLFEQAEV